MSDLIKFDVAFTIVAFQCDKSTVVEAWSDRFFFNSLVFPNSNCSEPKYIIVVFFVPHKCSLFEEVRMS